MRCERCGFTNGAADTLFCSRCGTALLPAAVRGSAMALAGVEGRMSYAGFPEEARCSGESLLDRLDREERDIFSRLDERLPADRSGGELDAEQWGAREVDVPSISATFDGLVADLLNAETREPEGTGFPPPEGARAPKWGAHMIDRLFVAAFVVAVFLFGMTVGLWGAYTITL